MDQLQNVITEQQSVKGDVVKAGAKNLQENIQLNEAEKNLTQNHFKEARGLFSQVINTHRDDSFELLNLGHQCFADGDLRAAEQAFTYAKDIPEVAPRAEQGISRIIRQRDEAQRQTKLGDAMWKIPEAAIDHYKQALVANPSILVHSMDCMHFFPRAKNQIPSWQLIMLFVFWRQPRMATPCEKEVEENILKLKKKIGKDVPGKPAKPRK